MYPSKRILPFTILMITHFAIDVNQPQREFNHDSRDLLCVFLVARVVKNFRFQKESEAFGRCRFFSERLFGNESRSCFLQKPFALGVPQYHSVEIVFGMPASYMNGIGEMEKIFEPSGRIKYLR